jgi:hypothetical protein
MDEIGQSSLAEIEVRAQSRIADVLIGSGRDQARRVAWGMTEQGDPLRLMHAAKNAGINRVIEAIREQTGSIALPPDKVYHVTIKMWVFMAGYMDGCEIIIVQRSVDPPLLTGGIRMRRRVETDPAEWFISS